MCLGLVMATIQYNQHKQQGTLRLVIKVQRSFQLDTNRLKIPIDASNNDHNVDHWKKNLRLITLTIIMLKLMMIIIVIMMMTKLMIIIILWLTVGRKTHHPNEERLPSVKHEATLASKVMLESFMQQKRRGKEYRSLVNIENTGSQNKAQSLFQALHHFIRQFSAEFLVERCLCWTLQVVNTKPSRTKQNDSIICSTVYLTQ